MGYIGGGVMLYTRDEDKNSVHLQRSQARCAFTLRKKGQNKFDSGGAVVLLVANQEKPRVGGYYLG